MAIPPRFAPAVAWCADSPSVIRRRWPCCTTGMADATRPGLRRNCAPNSPRPAATVGRPSGVSSPIVRDVDQEVGRATERRREGGPFAGAETVRARRALTCDRPCKIRRRTRVQRSVEGNSIGGASTSFVHACATSAHASHPCSARHTDPRERSQRRRSRPAAFHGGPSCPKAMAKWCL